MKILFCGDIVGSTGRQAVIKLMPRLIDELQLDWVIVNAENAAAGYGLTPDICAELFKVGVDVITTGNHVWDQKSIITYIATEPRVLRPLNYPTNTPGNGFCILEKPGKANKLMVINVMAQLFMDALDNPFSAIEHVLAKHPLHERGLSSIFLDIHGEATSEKMAMAHMVDGRISAVAGTHTHVPTADAHILPKGTGYITDAGMCGDYHSVIGMDIAVPINRFRSKMPSGRYVPATGEATVCGVYYDINDKTGLCDYIAPLRHGGKLSPAWPLCVGE